MPAHERRAFPREFLRINLRWEDGSTAYTRDVSPEGMYVWVDAGAFIADWVAVELTDPRSGLRFRAYAEVMRIEPGLTRTGVAMRLHWRRFLRRH
ncbi:PilZ domain-containing protein [Ramlibacter sp. AW1]|uniref:PilZ domain-containing protein n=1 Tax=Ramlibacter aurantiacus TaxID=2801330 RepID=A0A936ZKX5_9BURK|nr:PilZ domain-containing protein [Ramlibacter aurantiacus]MBL0419581.1 PilZ domain-containing protein [Ramlibacter aurantiacus]